MTGLLRTSQTATSTAKTLGNKERQNQLLRANAGVCLDTEDVVIDRMTPESTAEARATARTTAITTAPLKPKEGLNGLPADMVAHMGRSWPMWGTAQRWPQRNLLRRTSKKERRIRSSFTLYRAFRHTIKSPCTTGIPTCPSMLRKPSAPLSSRTPIIASEPTTSGRWVSECGQIGVSRTASTLGIKTGPPAASE